MKMNVEFNNNSKDKPRNKIQEKLQEFFEEVLDNCNIGIHESFFDLGGHSINALLLIAKIEKYFEIKMPIVDLFRNQTISLLDQYIKDKGYIEKETELYIEQLSSNGKKNVICIPSITTTPVEFMELSKQFDDVNFFAIDMAMLDKYTINENTVDLIVEKCIELIVSKNIEDKLTIIGYSTGARVAFELTRTMENRGWNVEDLVIIDSTPNMVENIEYRDRIDVVEKLIKSHPYYNCLEEKEKEKLLSRINKYCTLDSYIVNYGVINSNISVIYSEDNVKENFESWQTFTRKNLKIVQGKGNHFEIISKDFINVNKEFFTGILY